MQPTSDSIVLLPATTPRRCCCCCCPRHLALGLVIVCIVAATQTASSELTHVGLASLHAPFFTMWVHTSFMLLVLPVVVCGQRLYGCLAPHAAAATVGQQRPILLEMWDDGLAPADGPNGAEPPCALRWRPRCMPPLLWLAFCFYACWVAANYCYARALLSASPGLVTSVFSSCSAFVALLSRLWLHEPMGLAKLLSVALAVGGVLTLGLAHGVAGAGHDSPMLGMLLALGSSLSAAVYKVAYKVAFPGGISMYRLSLFLTLLGGVNVLVGACPRV